MADHRVTFRSLSTVDDAVNAIGTFLDQSPDRERWSCCCRVWHRALFERVWLYSIGTPGAFAVTVIGYQYRNG